MWVQFPKKQSLLWEHKLYQYLDVNPTLNKTQNSHQWLNSYKFYILSEKDFMGLEAKQKMQFQKAKIISVLSSGFEFWFHFFLLAPWPCLHNRSSSWLNWSHTQVVIELSRYCRGWGQQQEATPATLSLSHQPPDSSRAESLPSV